MNKLCRIFQSPYKPSQASMLFHTNYLPLSEFCDCGEISENNYFFLNLLKQKIFFDKNHWFQLLSTKIDWIISLFLISTTLHHSFIPPCFPSVGKPLIFHKNFIATPQQLTQRKKILFLGLLYVFLWFFSFSFFGLLGPHR